MRGFMIEMAFVNGALVESDCAQISIHDRAVMHGVGLFDTMRVYQGRVFRFDDHLDRLFASAAKLKLTITQSREELMAAIESVMSANGLAEARVRLTVSAGNVRAVTEEEPEPVSGLIVTVAEAQPYPQVCYENGITVIISQYKQNPDDPTAGHKTLNFFPRMVALGEAQAIGAGEAIWFTTTNRLAEGCVSNVFLVKDSVLLTPPVDTPVLPGIARQVVLELAKEFGIETREQECVVKDLLGADEVFMTNSIMEVMPVCHVEKHQVGAGEPGEITGKLLDGYRQDAVEGIA
jgi:branched-chain amino acid aminotransferase